MAENLKTTYYADGKSIPLITDNIEWQNLDDNDTDKAYCYYDNNANNIEVYGLLYTWAAASNGINSETNPIGVQGVCPTGWHLPSDAEWTELSDNLGGMSRAGDKMKEAGTSHWNSTNTGTTNESYFSALPGGMHFSFDGSFVNVGYDGYWWGATHYDASATCRFLTHDYAGVSRYNADKSCGFSVRCLRD